jgi:ribose transport system permease protein
MVEALSKRVPHTRAAWLGVLQVFLVEPQLTLTILLMLLMLALNPDFLTVRNLLLVLRQASVIGIVTCGVCWMMISGSFDLSVGSLVSLISVSAVARLQAGANPIEAIGIGLAVGLMAGLINGFLVGQLKANAFLTTLGTMTAFQGGALLVTGGLYFRVPLDSPYRAIADSFVGPLGTPILIFLAVALVMQLVLSLTPFGLRIYAIGGNERSAILAGIKVPAYRLLMYIATGVTAAIAAIVVSARAGSGHHFLGLNYEFNAITAAVLGGNYIFGGRGSVARGVWGAILLALLANAQTLLRIPSAMQLVVQGIVTLIIVGVQVLYVRKES